MMLSRLSTAWDRFVRIYHREIWQPAVLKDRSPRGLLYAALRVISITATVFVETKAASRAAALSFSSILGLGPLVAITVLVAGFALDNKDPNLAANTLSRLLIFVAPQLGQLSQLSNRSAEDEPADIGGGAPVAPAPAPVAPPPQPTDASERLIEFRQAVEVNPELVQNINGFISDARSGSIGVLGVLALIVIVLLLFKTIEDTFNEIWGVRAGRSIVMRIVYYWTILTLGAVLFFATVTLLSASAFFQVFNEAISHLPFSKQMAAVLQWSLPAFSYSLLALLLTAFYRAIPNTRVFWRAAFVGGLVVATLVMLNNFFAFLYVRRVILTKSLSGSLGLPLVAMFGLYIFWLYVLIGGQISYAVQNVHFRTSQAAWSNLTETMRERLSLIVLLTIARRFQACLPPVSSSQLSALMKVPAQILNECLNRLVDMKLVTPIPPTGSGGDPGDDMLFQPARPLNRINLLEFKKLDDNLGEDPSGTSLERLDPILRHYDEALDQLSQQPFFQKTLEELLAQYPFDESRPPFSSLQAPRS